MKEKCSKCFEWKERKEFIPLRSGAKPKCIACIEKQGKIEELKKRIDSTSALLFSLKEELLALGVSYGNKPSVEESIITKVKKIARVEKNKVIAKNSLRLHPRYNIAMKKGSDSVYYYVNGSLKDKTVWDGKFGKYTSYLDPKTNQWKYIGLEKLKQQIFRNDSKLGV